MPSKQQFCNSLSHTISRAATAALAIAIVFALTVMLAQSAQAQTFKVLYNFTGGADGASPQAGLTMDAEGNLYGTTFGGGYSNCPQYVGELPGCGVVFKLSKLPSGWDLTPIHRFMGMRQSDGANPRVAPLVFGPDGSLYGTTYGGGIAPRACLWGCGTVFKLTPSITGDWTETLLYNFRGGADGRHPGSDVVFDQAGNLYAITFGGGAYNGGTVYELSPLRGGWTESVAYSFRGGSDGFDPSGGVTFDQGGDLYGVTFEGGDLSCDGPYGCGTVFQLTPSESGWTKNILHSFHGGTDGYGPGGDLIFDQLGNMYGITDVGKVFMLSPSGSGWSFSVLYNPGIGCGVAGQGLTMDAGGNLYGATWCGGAYDAGAVFTLTHGSGGWTYTSLHDFTFGNDGARPVSTVRFDANGNLYGTAQVGGDLSKCSGYGCGVVWEITP